MTEYVLGNEFKAVVRHNHQPESGVDGLELRKGDIITVLAQDDSSGWAYGVFGDNEGWFPFSFVKKLDSESDPSPTTPTPSPSVQNTSKLKAEPTLKEPEGANDTNSSSDLVNSSDSAGNGSDQSSADSATPQILPASSKANNVTPPTISPRGANVAPTRAPAPARPNRTAVPVASTPNPVKNPAKITAKNPAQNSSQLPAKIPAKNSVQNSSQSSFQNSAQNETPANPPSVTRPAAEAPPPRPSPRPTQPLSNAPITNQTPPPPSTSTPTQNPISPATKPKTKKLPPLPPTPSPASPMSPTSTPSPLSPDLPTSPPPALPPKPATLRSPGSLAMSPPMSPTTNPPASNALTSQRSMGDLALAAASRVQKPAAKAGTAGNVTSPSLGTPGKVPANGISVFKPAGATPNGKPAHGHSGAGNPLAHSASAYSFGSKGPPAGAAHAQHALTRSTSEPNNAAAAGNIVLKASNKPKKQMKVLSKEMSLKIAVLLEDISALGAGSQHSGKNDEMEHYKEKYFATADEFATLKADSLTPLDLVYADCTSDPIPEKLPAKLNVTFHFSNNVEKSISLPSHHTVVEAIREAYRFSHVSFLPKDLQAQDCIAKLCGRAEYLPDTLQLHQVTFIRECMKRSQTVHVALVARTEALMTMLARARLPRPVRPFVEHYEAFFEDCHVDPESEVDTENALSHETFQMPFEIRVLSCEGFATNSPLYSQLFKPDKETAYIFVEASLYCGGSLLSRVKHTDPIYITPNPEWGEYISFDNMLVSDLPRHARLSLSVIVRKGATETPLGWVNIQLVDFRGKFRSGVRFLKLWPGARANPIGTCSENYAHDAATICFEFSNFPTLIQPVLYLPTIYPDLTQPTNTPAPDQAQMDELARIAATDCLYELSTTEMTLVWAHRDYIKSAIPNALPKVLLSAGWTIPLRLQQAVALLESWPLLSPHDALELLGARFPEAGIRHYAVKCLAAFEDEDLSLYLVQLVQALKYEPYLTSALASFLLERALKDRIGIGQQLFWFCRTELPQKETALRYSLLLATYLRATEEHVEVLLCQHELISKLLTITRQIKEESSATKRIKRLGELLGSSVFLSPTRQLPLCPTISIKNAVVEKCKVMDSAKLPMWAVFENADPLGTPAAFLFKTDDDLRQDVLVLQMLRIMDDLWKKEGLDLHLTCYGCTTTGDKMGMIEAVPNSQTVAHIQQEAGGATAAFKQTPLMNWLRESHMEDEFEVVVENFTRSCAGYVVGTYVLGIGDRHNDNIMVSRSGHLFHIDFGHFLGKIKYWAGIKRERAPFIFTPDFAYVLGGKESAAFARFVAVCCRSYNVLRRHAHLFINLFAMMLSTSIPELQTPDDVMYLRRAFMMDLDDARATEAFTSMIYESLATKSTQVNWAVHILAHQYK